MTDEELLESLDRHFLATYVLSPLQLTEHKATGTCPECRERSAAARTVEVIPCAGTPYRCDGFDPADWPPGEIPDFSAIRAWERRVTPSDR